jgi:hypothetical protein
MPRKSKKLSAAEQQAREIEVLNRPADTSNEAVKALLSPEFERMSNMDAAGIALLLQEIVRGQNSLLARYDETNIEIARIREKQEKVDQEIAERLEANKKFIEEVLDRAESLKRTGEAHDKLVAQGVAAYQQAKINATADIAAKNLMFDQKLASDEKVTVMWPGQLVTTMEHGQQVVKIIPEEVRIRHRVWVYPPGQAVEVPKTVAQFLDQRRASQQETAKRQELLSRNLESTKLAEEWSKIGGSKTDAMPT